MSASKAEDAPAPRAAATLTIVNKKGLHARASAKFAETARQFSARVLVSRDNLCVDAASIMGLLLLAASQGSEIEVVAEGGDAAEALAALEALVALGFGETGVTPARALVSVGAALC